MHIIKTKTRFLFIYIFVAITFLSCNAQNTSEKETSIIAEQIIYRNQKFDVVKIDLTKVELGMFWKNKEGKLIRSLENLKTVVESEGKELLFAMNAGMYQRDRNPQGLYIEKGKIIKPLDTLPTGYGNFYMQPNGVFSIKPVHLNGGNKKAEVLPSTVFSRKKINPMWATQSGPMLLVNNKVHPKFKEGSTNLNIRNGVGVNSDNEVVFVISQKEVNLYDFAMIFKEKLNCKNALYLDGFVSRAYIPQLERYDLDGDFGVMIGIMK